MSSFAKNLTKLIRERGTTIGAISRATGISTSTLSEWTAGRSPKVGNDLVKLSRHLEVSLDQLITGEREKVHDPEDIVADLLKEQFVTVHSGVYRLTVEKSVASKVETKKGENRNEK